MTAIVCLLLTAPWVGELGGLLEPLRGVQMLRKALAVACTVAILTIAASPVAERLLAPPLVAASSLLWAAGSPREPPASNRGWRRPPPGATVRSCRMRTCSTALPRGDAAPTELISWGRTIVAGRDTLKEDFGTLFGSKSPEGALLDPSSGDNVARAGR